MTRFEPGTGVENPLIERFRPRIEGATGTSGLTGTEAAELFEGYQKLERRLVRIARISDRYQAEIRLLVEQLQDALNKISVLKGCIPICGSCKKVRSDEGYWRQLEQYLADHSELLFSHGLCPDCAASYMAQARGAKPGSGGVPPAVEDQGLNEDDFDDPVVVEFLPLVNHPHFADSPLSGAFSALFRKYVRLSRRMGRIARISDSYQANLQEMKSRLDLSSRTDYLTGLANRREMYERLGMELSRARRHGREFAVVMFDFDHFKELNDRYGHAVGDRVLTVVAELVTRNLRREDSCCRWGGEEFLILLPETTAPAALVVAEKIRRLIDRHPIEADGVTVRATVSLGATVFLADESVDACIARADAALYQAKEAGRNRAFLLDAKT